MKPSCSCTRWLFTGFMLWLFALGSAEVWACDQQELQFIGNVINHNRSAISCTFEIRFSMANPSFVCPLTPGELSGVAFVDEPCALAEGDQISGVIVRRGDDIWIE